MSFVEFRFLWFFLAVFIVYWAMRNNTARKVWLLLCSYVFYAAWNWKFTFLVLGSTTVDYIVGQMLGRRESPAWRRFWIAASVCVNLGVLGFFKYFGVRFSGLARFTGEREHAQHSSAGRH
jgi:alginate O-acetyltransferase complex protein AlgI